MGQSIVFWEGEEHAGQSIVLWEGGITCGPVNCVVGGGKNMQASQLCCGRGEEHAGQAIARVIGRLTIRLLAG